MSTKEPKQTHFDMDCSSIRFCCGSCTSTVEETPERIFLKPNDGKRYARLTWETQDGMLVDLFNVRICRSCCHRYMEIKDGVAEFDFKAIEMMQRDAQRVIQKLGLQGV